jgi:phosphoribosylaminoimidazole-succinocarboxamide synthase
MSTAANMIGRGYAAKVESLSLQIYNAACEYALSKGIIMAVRRL